MKMQNKRIIKINLEGISQERQVAYIEGEKITDLAKQFDGHKLTELNISASISSMSDIDDLIHLLMIHKPCLPRICKECGKST